MDGGRQTYIRNTHAPRVRLEGTAKHAIETGRGRLLAVGAVFALLFVVLAGRLVDLTLVRHAGPAGSGGAVTANLTRGDIVDRNGVLLATNLRTASLFANPRSIPDVGEATAAGQQQWVGRNPP